MSVQLLIIVLVGTTLRIAGAMNIPVTFDEAYTILISRISNLLEITTTTAYSHPPLYFLVLHFWQLISQSLLFARILSLIFGIVTIFAIAKIGEKLANRQTGNLTALLAAISPTLIYYSAIARMYSFAIFLSLVMIFLFIKFLKIRSGLFPLVMITIMGLYTHYFVSILFFSMLVFGIVAKNKLHVNFRQILLLSIIMLTLYIPALVLLVTSPKSISQPENSLLKLPAMMVSLAIPWDAIQSLKVYQSNSPNAASLVAAAMILILFAVFAWGAIALRKNNYVSLVSFLCFFSAVFILGISFTLFKIAGIRSFVIFSPAFLLLIAISITKMSKILRNIIFLSISILTLIFLGLYARDSFGAHDLAQQVWSNFGKKDIIVYNDPTFFMPTKIIKVNGTHLLMYPGHLPPAELQKIGVDLASFEDIPLTKKVWYVKIRTRWPPYEEFTNKLEVYLGDNFSEVKRVAYWQSVYVREGLDLKPIPYYPLQLVLYAPKSP